MPAFSARSLGHLVTVHLDGQAIMNEVIKMFDCTILEGHRSIEQQNAYFEQGLSKLKGDAGPHTKNPSMAWHAMPWFLTEPHIDWNHNASMAHLAGFIRGVAFMLHTQGKITHLVRWGGDWDRDFDVREKQWNDLAHYELYKI